MHHKREIELGRYGAPIERGRVRSIENGLAVVISLDRDGLVTLPLQMMAAAAEGDAVFFCQFEDGMGLVLARIETVEE